jgi:hypothetical protein
MSHPRTGERTWIDEAADRFESDWKRCGNALIELGLTTPLGSMRLIDEVSSTTGSTSPTTASSPAAHASASYSTNGFHAGGAARCLPESPPRSTTGPSSGSPTGLADGRPAGRENRE